MNTRKAALPRLAFAALVAALGGAGFSAAQTGDLAQSVLDKPLIDNERVSVWDCTWTSAAPAAVLSQTDEAVWISIAPSAGEVVHWAKGEARQPKAKTGRAIVIDLKDHPVPPIKNTSGYPNAFPRPGSKKVFENPRIVVWDYSWKTGKPTPMHFHDKDVVAVFLGKGSLQSTTPDGTATVSKWEPGDTRFNARDRAHTETLVDGQMRAILTELK